MRVLIFGGHGKVALQLEPLLAGRGDEVVAVVRNPDHVAEVEATGARVVVLDVESADAEALAGAVDGFDAIVWSAGAGGGSAARTYAVDRDAAMRTMDAAAAAGVRRYVMVSWIGSSVEHGIDPDDSFFAYADAKLAADDHLRASDLEWTILGPGTLTSDAPTGRIEIDPDGSGDVSRADVARVVVEVLDDPSSVGRFIRFGSGATPIVEALRG
jgi:uncharacterized protein YbjT (DUF2867 family)